MTDTWTTHHKDKVGGRPVEVKTHSEGVFRVSTTQAEDDPGSVTVDGSSAVVMPPTEKGRAINIDGANIADVRKGLAEEGFDKDQIEEIVAHFPD